MKHENIVALYDFQVRLPAPSWWGRAVLPSAPAPTVPSTASGPADLSPSPAKCWRPWPGVDSSRLASRTGGSSWAPPCVDGRRRPAGTLETPPSAQFLGLGFLWACWESSHLPLPPECQGRQRSSTEGGLATARPSGVSGPAAATVSPVPSAGSGQPCRPGPPVWASGLFVDITPAAWHWPLSPCVRLGEGRG